MNLLIQETFVNATENCIFWKTDFRESDFSSRGEAFKELQKEYGRCISKVYRELRTGADKQVGWVFQKRDQYTDSNKTYLREVWVEVKEPEAEVNG